MQQIYIGTASRNGKYRTFLTCMGKIRVMTKSGQTVRTRLQTGFTNRISHKTAKPLLNRTLMSITTPKDHMKYVNDASYFHHRMSYPKIKSTTSYGHIYTATS